MTRKLNEQDRAAVDLVLDRFAAVGRDNGMISTLSQGAPEERVQSVEQILSVLSQMPAPEPEEDLVTRTLRRIDQIHANAPRQIPPYLGPDQLPA
jgi:hypothetical protein